MKSIKDIISVNEAIKDVNIYVCICGSMNDKDVQDSIKDCIRMNPGAKLFGFDSKNVTEYDELGAIKFMGPHPGSLDHVYDTMPKGETNILFIN